jgi:sporulation protein YlmC with PRC-barrel domain
MKRLNRMPWYAAIVMFIVSLGATSCLRIEAAAVTPGPTPSEILTEDFVGMLVVSSEGQRVGPIDGLIMGTTSAEVSYVIVRIEDVYDFGKGGGGPQDRFLVIPWSHLLIAGPSILRLDVDAAFVDRAPRLNDLPNTDSPLWDADIQAYWAQ